MSEVPLLSTEWDTRAKYAIILPRTLLRPRNDDRYRGTSLVRNNPLPEPCRRTMQRDR